MSIRRLTRCVTDLDIATRTSMWHLFGQSFPGHRRETFEKDLAAKNSVVLLYDDDGLAGFSTFSSRRFELGAEGPLTLIYSGDTIVNPSAQGTQPTNFVRVSCAHAITELCAQDNRRGVARGIPSTSFPHET